MVIAGIDLGTSSLKVVLLHAETRQLLTQAATDYRFDTPVPGAAEQDPAIWWQVLRQTLAAALRQAGLAGGAVRALGLSGQMHGVVPLAANGQVVRPALLWCDQRGQEVVDRLAEQIAPERLLAITGSRLAVNFSAVKLAWMQQYEPAQMAQVRWMLQPKDYLAWRLTGEIGTEPTDASATLLFDLGQRHWSDELLATFAIPAQILPAIRPTLRVIGRLTAQAAAELGLSPQVVVAAGAGDTPAQSVGYGITEPGAVLATISSGGQYMVVTDQPLIDPAGRLHTFCHVQPDAWYVLGALQSAGLSLRWLRDLLGLEYARLGELAASIPAATNDLLFLPYLMGERTPHLDNQARGVFVGLAPHHGPAAMARAVMEGVAFAFRDAAAVVQELGWFPQVLYLGGGGAQSRLWQQIFADVFACPVVPTSQLPGAAVGAALMAGYAAGYYTDLTPAPVQADSAMVTPEPQVQQRYQELFAIYRRLYPQLRGSFQDLAQFAAQRLS